MGDVALDPSLEAFFEHHVQPRLRPLQARRRVARVAALAVVLVPAAVLPGSLEAGLSQGVAVTMTVVTFFVAAIVAAVFYARFQGAYKAEIVAPLMKRLDPGAAYDSAGKISRARITEAGCLPDYTDFESEDVVRGQSIGTGFEFANVTLKKKKGKHTKTVFHGLFYQAADSRERLGTTVVVPAGGEPNIDGVDDPHEVRLAAGGDTFEAFTTAPEEAARLLTPSVMAALARLSKALETQVFASFSPGKVSVAAGVGDFFEPGFLRPLVTRRDIARIATLFSTSRGLAQELGMPGDSHFAHGFDTDADEDDHDDEDEQAGDDDQEQEEEGGEQQAVPEPSATFFSQPLADAPSLQPLVERLRGRGYGVTMLGQSSLTVEYGASARMWISLVAGMVWVAAGVMILDRATEWPSGGTLAAPFVEAFPPVEDALAWLAQFHPASSLLPIALGLLRIVGAQRRFLRRIVLTPQAVERVGGLLPGTRTRPLKPGGAVVVRGGRVYVKSEGIRGVPVSPPLAADVAGDLSKLVAGFRRSNVA